MDEFKGKSLGKTNDGTSVFSYDESAIKKEDSSIFYLSTYMEEIEDHFDKCFPGRETSVFHELLSLPGELHIDVHFMCDPENANPIVVYTTGMSDFLMVIPDDVEEERNKYERAELMMYLPVDWPVNDDDFNKDVNYWPIKLLKTLARFPQKYSTWLGPGHTVPNTEGTRPYNRSTKLNGVILLPPADELGLFTAKDGTLINIYGVVPLYKEEMNYKLKHGVNALIDKLLTLNTDATVINPSRKNTCYRSLLSILTGK